MDDKGMDLEQLHLEIEEIIKRQPENGEIDSPDGFRKYVQRQLAKFSCVSGKSGENDNLEATNKEKPSALPKPPSSSQDFQESRTAFITSEERAHVDMENEVYNFTYPKRGLAVIINNENFAAYSRGEFGDRPGSSYDRASLYRAFTTLGFDVMVYNDLRAAEMVEVLRQASRQYDHARADCFACAVLTHGDQTWTEKEYERLGTKVRQDLLFGVDGRVLTTQTAIEWFSDRNCPGLAGKPRLFFLQACRGAKYDDGTKIKVIPREFPGIFRGAAPSFGGGESSVDHTDKGGYQRSTSLSSSVDPPQYHRENLDSVDAKADTQTQEQGQGGDVNLTGTDPAGLDQPDARWFPIQNVPVSPAPLYKDFLVMYATPPGHFAWRRRNGAWFVQCLCRLLTSPIVDLKPLMSILVMTIGHVARDYKSENPNTPEMDQKKECPVIESMLVKDVFLKKKLVV